MLVEIYWPEPSIKLNREVWDCQQQTDLELIGPAFPTFTLAPPAVKEKVKHMLAEGKYIFT